MGDVVQLSWWPGAADPTHQRDDPSTSTSGMLPEVSVPEIDDTDLDLLPPATGDHLAERLMWAMCVELNVRPSSILSLTRREVSKTDNRMTVTVEGVEVGGRLSHSVRGLLAAHLDSYSGEQVFAFCPAEPSLNLSGLPDGADAEPGWRPVVRASAELAEPSQLAIFAVDQTADDPALPAQVAAILALEHGLQLPPSRRGYACELVHESRQVLVEALNEAMPIEPTLLPTGPLGPGLATGPTDRLVRLLQRSVRAALSTSDPWGEQDRARVRADQLIDPRGLPRVWRQGYQRGPVQRHLLRVAALLDTEASPSLEGIRSLLTEILPTGWRGYEQASVDQLIADAVWSLVGSHDFTGEETPTVIATDEVVSPEPAAVPPPDSESLPGSEPNELFGPTGAPSRPFPVLQLALFAG